MNCVTNSLRSIGWLIRCAARTVDGQGRRFVVVAALAALAGCDRSDVPMTAEAGRVPVLLVHGSGLDSGLWLELREHLLSSGYSPADLLAVEMKPADGSNPEAARRFIAPAVQQLLQQSARAAEQQQRRPPGRVDIVAHSMGAISSRWYIAFMRPERVRLWIGIAPANHGTDALCGFNGAGDRELCPAFATARNQSAVQARLNGTPDQPVDLTPFGLGIDDSSVSERPDAKRCIAYFTVRIEPDEWIKPERSALLAGAGGLPLNVAGLSVTETSPGNFLFTAPTNHDDLPRQREIAEFVERVVNSANDHYPQRCQTGA